MKRWISRNLLRLMRRRLISDPHPFNRLLGRAVTLQLGEISDEQFRLDLDEFYRDLDPAALVEFIDFAAKADRLSRPGTYKVDVTSMRGDTSSDPQRKPWDLWGRRFALLRHIGVRADVLVLRGGETVPPHGHHRVVSGFYVIEGEVAIRHYDRVRETDGGVLVTKALDATLGDGGYTTNSEYHQNIHWLSGAAPTSFLFRMTVTETPTTTFGSPNRSDTRVYVDPTGLPDDAGLIAAPYIKESVAKAIAFDLGSVGTASRLTR